MLLDPKELRSSSEMHPQILEYTTKNPQPAVDWEDWRTVRAKMTALSQQGLDHIGAPESAITEEYRDLSMRDGVPSTIKIHKPTKPPADGSPLIVVYFGGGFIGGDVNQATAFARAYVRLFGAVVVAPSCRLAPEHKFPAGQYDAWDSLEWLDEHAAEDFGVNFSKGFIVSGTSAGASNAAVVVTHAIVNKLKHPITGQYLCVPSLFDHRAVPDKFRPYWLAMEHNKDAPLFQTKALQILQDLTKWDAKSAWRYPVYSHASLSEQPPTYLQADGMDPIRDDALIWEEMLKEAGVRTKIDFYSGCPHAHFSFFPGIEVSNKAIADMMMGVAWLLGDTIAPAEGLGAMLPPQQASS